MRNNNSITLCRLVRVQILAAINNLNVLETYLQQFSAIILDLDRSGNASCSAVLG